MLCTASLVFGTTLLGVVLSADPIVQLPQGQIQGRQTQSLQNKVFYAFEGIPYAKPPTGTLRFKAPQAPDNWEGVLNTTSWNTVCYQTDEDLDNESEDCLYLSVYTPQLPDDANNVSLPVMVFIYGGGFLDGYSQAYRPDLFMNYDVILVFMNYRIGILGFLSTQDEVIPGNNGLKDQQMAIKWTNTNIQLFGGDPNKVTIFGQSAGAASVGYHLLNQNNTGLFQGAILQSGTSINPWAFQRNAKAIAFNVASILNSTFQTNTDSTALLEYLQNVEPQDLKTAVAQYRNNLNPSALEWEFFNGLTFAPVIEVKNPDAFLTRKMFGLLQAGNVVPVPIIIGMTSEEYLTMAPDPVALESLMEIYDADLTLLIPDDMQLVDSMDRQVMGNLIRNIYTVAAPLSEYLGFAIQCFSDNAFSRSIIKFSKLYAPFAPTYFYQFSYNGELGHVNASYEYIEGGVGHGEELYYMLCYTIDCDDSAYPEDDRVARQRLLQLWTDFAKYQNPTPEDSDLLQNITWPVVDPALVDHNYLYLAGNLEIRNEPKRQKYIVWEFLYGKLNVTDFDTY